MIGNYIGIGSHCGVDSINSGLISYWSLDEPSGTVYDSKGINNGTVTGATQNQSGYKGKSILFDAVGEIINCGTDISVRLTEAFSFACWFKAAVVQTTYGRIINKEANYGIYLDPATNYIEWNGSSSSGHFTTTTYNDNAWHQIVVTFDKIAIKGYIDGVYKGEIARSSSLVDSASVPLTIGNRVAGDRNFIGYIDEVRLWNRPLTSDEVTRLFNSY